MLTPEERQQVEQRLGEERGRVLGSLEEFDRARAASIQEETGELTMYRLHPADIGSEAMEREQMFLLASNEGRQLNEIDQALSRLYGDPEAFGACERCGGSIGMERLAIVPFAKLCAVCQRAEEEEVGGR